ncbi:SDR family NAD(P)-dependent oxidoreductase [Pseudobacteriovorax antillogorgiicola]|uniref:NAD(P)-dependent dehydrogenase, short-chain alcohol dehydrogenase family n=1 Tax=Pseudobacteriovorax antillogorgiicola TaxID=1513793 RepID=A0A1Y6BH36_9BACT|nr:SDR family NAD(P)-dependent oxidoreductase [Pseudobacteriovorax antillogorgiicola]TCS55567.1 NAD(P)-dependent dehydrogenase (short-subunit alcohol dehydrogenase family) [Pseudobacteriovorax antillogorgiicola]SMF10821.1 NAD(P)-dependent dehydrogenase, short-chain alcohol dehydrogenase family [Pseudobacteriovorax antillogorgiicola]
MISIMLSEPFELSGDDTFAYLQEVSRYSEWDDHVLESHQVDRGPIQIGTKFNVTYRILRQELTLYFVLSALKPGRDVLLEAQHDHFQVQTRFTIDNQAKRLSWQTSVHFDGIWNNASPVLKTILKSELSRSFQKLVRALNPSKQVPDLPDLKTQIEDHLLIPGLLRFSRLGYQWETNCRYPVIRKLNKHHIVITGASSGIGEAAARQLALLGADITIIARNEIKAKASVNRLRQESHSRKKHRYILADLSLARDVDRTIGELVKLDRPIDCLINNAGYLYQERQETDEGIEKSFALLLMAPYRLTLGVKNLLKRAPLAQVINVSSGGMYTQRLKADHLTQGLMPYDGTRTYAQLKRALVMLSELWAQEWEPDGILVHAMHPGWADTKSVAETLPRFYQITKAILRTPDEGADTITWLASHPDLSRTNGRFWMDRRVHPTVLIPGTNPRKTDYQILKETLQNFEPETPLPQ